MGSSTLHYIQAALLSSITALCLALTVVDSLLIEFILRRTDFDDNAIYTTTVSRDGIVTRWWVYWMNAVNRSYFALIAVGGAGLFMALGALISLLVLRRVNIRLPFIRGKNSRPLHSAPIIVILMAILIPGFLVTLVMSFIDNRDSYMDTSICEYGSLDYYNVTGYAFCTSEIPLTVEQWTCHWAHAAWKDHAFVERPGAVKEWCTNSRFARWSTVPLLILATISLSVALLQFSQRKVDSRKSEWESTFTKLADDDENSIVPSTTSGNNPRESYISRITASSRASNEIMSSPVSEIGDNRIRIPTELKGTTSLPVEKGDDRRRSSEIPMASGSGVKANDEPPRVCYI